MCLLCDGKFTYNERVNKGKYCSLKCSAEHRSKEALEKAITKFEKGELTDRNRVMIKRILTKHYGHNGCSICGITDWQGKKLPFILDHIDGNANNNWPDNLRLVCSNCDSQLDTYKRKNKLGRKRRNSSV